MRLGDFDNWDSFYNNNRESPRVSPFDRWKNEKGLTAEEKTERTLLEVILEIQKLITRIAQSFAKKD